MHPDYSYARVLDGFSALVDSSAIPIIERDDDVAGVFPVRVAYPASISDEGARPRRLRPAVRPPRERRRSRASTDAASRSRCSTPASIRRRAVSARTHPGRASTSSAATPARSRPRGPTIRRSSSATARRWPACSSAAAGPTASSGVATGASVLPIRVAGWQPDAFGHWAIYARSDQMIAGLDRAVDPNDDGDAHDAARVALVALAEPFAGFADGPEARAAAGALALDTLVVAPSGNDGRAGAGYGDIAAPGGSPAALTVGAVDTRTQTDRARIVVRAGLTTLLDGTASIAGVVRPTSRLDLEVAAPRGTLGGTRSTAPRITDFFTPHRAQPRRGTRRARADGRVAGACGCARRRRRRVGRAALRRPRAAAGGRARPRRVDRRAGRRGARARRACGTRPHGARASRSRSRCASRRARRTPEQGRVAGFSSAGLAFDGRVKPDLVAPGVGLATSDPGRQRGRLAALRHRQRLERRSRDRRGRRRAARAGAAVARRERARRPPDRHGAARSRASP